MTSNYDANKGYKSAVYHSILAGSGDWEHRFNIPNKMLAVYNIIVLSLHSQRRLFL
jgi:hypothetical protein